MTIQKVWNGSAWDSVGSSGGVAESEIDAKGDLLAGTADDTISRLAVGTDDYVLTADAAEATGLKWAASSGTGSSATYNEGTCTGTENLAFAEDTDSIVHDMTMTGNCTFPFTDSPTDNTTYSMTVIVRGPFTPTWPAAVDWAGGTEPTYVNPSTYGFMTVNQGTDVIGFMAGAAGTGTGDGDVVGPDSPITDNGLVTFDGTTGKLIQDPQVLVSDLAGRAGWTAKGDILGATADSTPLAINVGANDTVLTANSAAADGTGVEWAAIPSVTTITANTQTDNYVLVLTDAGKAIEMNKATAVNLTVPPNLSVAFPTGTVIEIYNMGAGIVTVQEGSGVTVRNVGALAAQFATASLRKRGTDEWVLAGALA